MKSFEEHFEEIRKVRDGSMEGDIETLFYLVSMAYGFQQVYGKLLRKYRDDLPVSFVYDCLELYGCNTVEDFYDAEREFDIAGLVDLYRDYHKEGVCNVSPGKS